MFEPGAGRPRQPVRGSDLVDLRGMLAVLAGLGRDASVGDAEVLARIGALEDLKAGAAAAQARLTVQFADSRERAARAAREAARGRGFESWQDAVDGFRGDRGVAAQVGLARRVSPWQAARAVSFARALASDLPATAAALTAGVLSERRALIVERETSHLLPADRRMVDEQVCGDTAAVGLLGDRQVEAAARAAGYRIDPDGVCERARVAESERRVPIRPLPDLMCRVSGVLPLADGVGVYAALSQAADTAKAAGDARGRGQVMADTLVERVTGRAPAQGVPVEVQVVISDAALLSCGAGGDDPGRVVGYGPVPAGWVRDLITAPPPKGCDQATRAARVWLRRLYATPHAGELVAMESRRRVFPGSLRAFLAARDQTCRTPWCDAPVRHHDHVTDHARGGVTSAGNGQGLCERCNHTKQLPGWRVDVLATGTTRRDGVEGRAGPHTVRWRTPTGTTYDSTAPPVLPAATPRADISVLERAIEIQLDLAA